MPENLDINTTPLKNTFASPRSNHKNTFVGSTLSFSRNKAVAYPSHSSNNSVMTLQRESKQSKLNESAENENTMNITPDWSAFNI
jgi:hypothetical protein